MTTETIRAKGKLTALSKSLDELESYLEPLFSQTLPETLVGLEPIQQAKVQTVVPYLVHDLVFIYLKLRGIDPKTHPVVPELDRVRQYFEKISSAENPPARRAEIDKAAASRFIKNAITQVKWTKTAAEEEDIEKLEASTPENIPIKVTSKMQERAQYEKDIREMDARGEEEEEDLVVFEGDEGAVESLDTQKSGESSSNKRRRPLVDPFAGYGDDAPEDNTTTSKRSKQTLPESNEASSSIAKTKATRKKSKDEPAGTNAGEGSKKRKTKKKSANSS